MNSHQGQTADTCYLLQFKKQRLKIGILSQMPILMIIYPLCVYYDMYLAAVRQQIIIKPKTWLSLSDKNRLVML